MTNWHLLATERGYRSDEEMLRALYTADGLSISTIADLLQLSNGTVRERLLFHIISIRTRGGPNNAGKGKSRLDDVSVRWWNTLSNDQIAERLDMHPSTVNKYKKRRDEKVQETEKPDARG